MVSILSLWLPIVLSAVAVFVISSLVHMVLGYHRSDYRALPREAEVRAALRGADLTPGTYFFPHLASPKEMGTPESVAKYREGPVGMLTVLPNRPPAMGKHLAWWFLYTLLVSLFVGYVTGRSLAPGVEGSEVFRIATTAAFLAYGIGQIPESIWRGQLWGVTAKNVLDGLLYAAATGGVFVWLWP